MSTICAGAVDKAFGQRTSSCDTVCSTNSSCFLQKKKNLHPLASSLRTQITTRNNASSVKQRVLSARLLKLRSLQSQLNDANFHLSEMQQENRALKTLQKRQDKALTKYEGTNADLPRLLQSHEEEIRVLHAKNKLLRKTLKEFTDQLKTKEDELNVVREQLKHLQTLSKDRNLEERGKLAEQVEDLKDKLKSNETQIVTLNRKLMLETKNYKYKLNGEILKHKQCQKDLTQALMDIERLTEVVESKQKSAPATGARKRITKPSQLQSLSLVNLDDHKESENSTLSIDVSTTETESVELIQTTSHSGNSEKDKEMKSVINGMLMSSKENLKARLLSAGSSKSQKLKAHSSETDLLSSPDYTFRKVMESNTKPKDNLNFKVEKLSEKMSLKKRVNANQTENDVIEGQIADCYQTTLSTIKSNSININQHEDDLNICKSETQKLLESIRQTDELNSQLRHSDFLNTHNLDIPEKDLGILDHILQEEYTFKSDKKSFSFKSSDRNGNIITQDMEAHQEDKQKLLATLKAIDNGEDVADEKNDALLSARKSKLLQDLFGSVDDK